MQSCKTPIRNLTMIRQGETMTIALKGFEAASPRALIPKSLSLAGETLRFNGRSYDISRGVKFIAFGKASLSLSEAFVNFLGINRIIKGIVVAPEMIHSPLLTCQDKVELIKSSHPLVSEASVLAGEKVLKFADECAADDLVFCLISGGGSSLLASPLKGITVEEKIKFINDLIFHGIGEREVNIIRKALSSIKGGKLARRIHPAKIINLVLSDERNHQLEAIASGPTVPNTSGLTAGQVIENADLWALVPENRRETLIESAHRAVDYLEGVDINTGIIGSRDSAIIGMREFAETLDLDSVYYVEEFFHEDVDRVSVTLGKEYSTIYANACMGKHLVLAHGEVPVKVISGGLGGRNQHLAALMIDVLKDFKRFEFAAVASDGCDYISGCQGAIISDVVMAEIEKSGIDYQSYIEATDTFHLHNKLGTLIKGGYTGTNVSDFYILLFEKK